MALDALEFIHCESGKAKAPLVNHQDILPNRRELPGYYMNVGGEATMVTAVLPNRYNP